MPCMNSTSAGDRCGATPVVESGSLLLGFPGAPGCTTTGPESDCCGRAGAAAAGKLQSSVAIRHPQDDAAVALMIRGLQLLSARSVLDFRIRPSIFVSPTVSCVPFHLRQLLVRRRREPCTSGWLVHAQRWLVPMIVASHHGIKLSALARQRQILEFVAKGFTYKKLRQPCGLVDLTRGLTIIQMFMHSQLLVCETQHDTAAKEKVVLHVVCAVGKLRPRPRGIEHPNGKTARDTVIHAAANLCRQTIGP